MRKFHPFQTGALKQTLHSASWCADNRKTSHNLTGLRGFGKLSTTFICWKIHPLYACELRDRLSASFINPIYWTSGWDF